LSNNKSSENSKCAYICSALTELPADVQEPFKFVLSKTADVCAEVLGVRGFAPHEHNDPVHVPDKTPMQVDAQERPQVGQKTSVLIVFTNAPSWGGGIEVEIAHQNNVPVVLLRQMINGTPRKVSRLLLGNPAVREIVDYTTYVELFDKLRVVLPRIVVSARKEEVRV
jgi:hypothetical protein